MTDALHYFNIGVRNLPVSVACLVSCQLFPYGRHRFEVCRTFRNQQALGLDDRLIYMMIFSKPSITIPSAISKPALEIDYSDYLDAPTMKFTILWQKLRKGYTPIIVSRPTLTLGA